MQIPVHTPLLLLFDIYIYIFYYFFFKFFFRGEAVCPRVAELNPYVHVDVSFSDLDESSDLSFLRKYQVRLLREPLHPVSAEFDDEESDVRADPLTGFLSENLQSPVCSICVFSLLQCVILTEASLSLLKRVNEFCHSHRPPIRVGPRSREQHNARLTKSEPARVPVFPW